MREQLLTLNAFSEL